MYVLTFGPLSESGYKDTATNYLYIIQYGDILKNPKISIWAHSLGPLPLYKSAVLDESKGYPNAPLARLLCG